MNVMCITIAGSALLWKNNCESRAIMFSNSAIFSHSAVLFVTYCSISSLIGHVLRHDEHRSQRCLCSANLGKQLHKQIADFGAPQKTSLLK